MMGSLMASRPPKQRWLLTGASPLLTSQTHWSKRPRSKELLCRSACRRAARPQKPIATARLIPNSRRGGPPLGWVRTAGPPLKVAAESAGGLGD